MGFSRQEHWSGLSFPPPGDFSDPGTEPISPVAPALQADSLPLSLQGRLVLGLFRSEVMEKAMTPHSSTLA